MIKTWVTIDKRAIIRKRGYLRKKYISMKMKNQSIVIIPPVLPSTIYQITRLVHIAIAMSR